MRLILKAHFDELEYGVEMGLPHSYEVEIGLRKPTEAAFEIEPLVKEERLIARVGQRKVVMMERKGPMVALRNEDGAREVHQAAVLPSEKFEAIEVRFPTEDGVLYQITLSATIGHSLEELVFLLGDGAKQSYFERIVNGETRFFEVYKY